LPNPPYYTVEEVAERYSVKPTTVYAWIRTNQLGHVRIGERLIRVSEDDLTEFEKRPPDQTNTKRKDA